MPQDSELTRESPPAWSDPLAGPIATTFLAYAAPSIIGMIAISSAFIVDGIFVGNYIGASALAAVNLTMPVGALFFALSLTIAVGGSVICGKMLGQGRADEASSVYSAIVISSLIVSLSLCAVGVLFIDELVRGLGANDELAPMVKAYLMILVIFAPFLMIGFVLTYFVRVDGFPTLASAALLLSAMANIFLDWLFIAELEWGIEGAAAATGLAQGSIALLFIPYLLLRDRRLKLNVATNGFTYLPRAVANGISEGSNEVSGGVITLLFNWIMITAMGVAGVAAYTIVNFLIFAAWMVFYGIGEALQPLVSQNLGARQLARITSFVKAAVACALCTGVITIIVLYLVPETLIRLFIAEDSEKAVEIARQFLIYVWPVFLLSGVNIVISTYFTAIHKPVHSAGIALSRSLILPGALLLALPAVIGNTGIYVAIPVAEFATLLVAITLYRRNRLRGP